MLHFWDQTWDLRLAECPCDMHFLEWLEHEKIKGQSIFHFGTGSHHIVGLKTAEDGSGNAVLGITASPGEYDAYVKMLIGKPKLGFTYKAYFGDIYQLDPRLLPVFDIVTLFHTGEFRSEKNDAYGALTDLETTLVLADAMRPGGRMLFYEGSYAFDVAERTAAELVRQRPFVADGSFKSLRIFKKSAKPGA
jgi:hypothetical protein